MAELFAMISELSVRLMNLSDYRLKVGNPADVVIFSASLHAKPIWGLRASASPRSKAGIAKSSFSRFLTTLTTRLTASNA